jgi:hypothetical protein
MMTKVIMVMMVVAEWTHGRTKRLGALYCTLGLHRLQEETHSSKDAIFRKERVHLDTEVAIQLITQAVQGRGVSVEWTTRPPPLITNHLVLHSRKMYRCTRGQRREQEQISKF